MPNDFVMQFHRLCSLRNVTPVTKEQYKQENQPHKPQLAGG